MINALNRPAAMDHTKMSTQNDLLRSTWPMKNEVLQGKHNPRFEHISEGVIGRRVGRGGSDGEGVMGRGRE